MFTGKKNKDARHPSHLLDIFPPGEVVVVVSSAAVVSPLRSVTFHMPYPFLSFAGSRWSLYRYLPASSDGPRLLPQAVQPSLEIVVNVVSPASTAVAAAASSSNGLGNPALGLGFHCHALG